MNEDAGVALMRRALSIRLRAHNRNLKREIFLPSTERARVKICMLGKNVQVAKIFGQEKKALAINN